MPTLTREGLELEEGQRGVPIVWIVPTTALVPSVSDDDLEPAFGPGAARRIKSFGHTEDGVHWLVTRAGTALHTDTGYTRYSHHLIVRNDGFRIRGLSDKELPILVPGILYCLDTHSPHEVVNDDRMKTDARRRYKVQLAVDSDDVLDPKELFAQMRRALKTGMHPRQSAALAGAVAPR